MGAVSNELSRAQRRARVASLYVWDAPNGSF
jgi:hypothetical protein